MWYGPAYGELDLFALLAILGTSFTVIVPLLNWSKTLRNLGSHEGQESGTRTIILYWGFLVVLGLVTIISQLNNFIITTAFIDLIVCVPPGSKMNNTAGQDPSWPYLIADAEWLEANKCNNPCQPSAHKPPLALFRSLSDLQPPSQKEISDSVYVFSGPFIQSYFYRGAPLAVFVLVQAIWAALFGRQTPRQYRMTIYSLLKDVSLPLLGSHQTGNLTTRIGRVLRRGMAKYVAIVAYLWAVVASVLCVLLFFISIAASEYLLMSFPQSESAM